MISTEYVDTVIVESYIETSLSGIYINGISIEEVLNFSKEDITQEQEEEESNKVTFESRLEEPSKTDRNWIVSSRGGTNRCINISQGSVLPNCVGYAWGRWSEILGEEHCLSNSHAEKWYLNTSDGYDRGQTPKVGAVICWSKGSTSTGADGYGHVAIVEEIYEDGSILISESSYGGDSFTTRVLSNKYHLSGQVFQGFIYIPLEFYTDLELEEMAKQEEIEVKQKQMASALKALKRSFSPTVKMPDL